MHSENVTYDQERAAKASAVHANRDQSHADQALMDLEKADAELAHVVNALGTRLRPVSAMADVPEDGMAMAADPSVRSPLVCSIRAAVDRTQRMTRLVLEITEGLDV